MTIDLDHPHVRQLVKCVYCGRRKDAGLLICWPCHRREKAMNGGGYSERVERALDQAEEG